ncbi:MAG TPA: glycosyltransferase [Actinomycetota bacterium]|nr:glycosyltransferase [Actinomycetota bacterium]
MPKLSVIVPTRQRPDTLRCALATAVAQTWPDTEILVQECGNDPETAAVVAEVGDGRTRHCKTGDQVPMTENWEQALSAATGDYLTIIGDDDGILPTACAAAAAVLERYPVDLVTWRPAAYFWPQSTVESLQNRLQAYLPATGFEQQDPRVLLELAYRFRDHHYTMPMVLHSFVSRELVDRVRAETGAYFHSPAPDIASGVADTLFGRSCVLAHQPLSISGLSHHSTGSRLHFNRNQSLREEAERAAFDGLTFHPTLVNSRNSQLFAANEMMTLKQKLFPAAEPAFDYRNLIQRALDSLATGLEDYDAGLEDIRRTAELNGISMEDYFVPGRPGSGPREPQGVAALGPGSLLIDVDCGRAGTTDVAGATRLLAALMPPFEPPAALPAPVAQVRAVGAPQNLAFHRNGNGLLLLESGWGQPEPWGVWSIAPRAEVRWTVDGTPDRPVELAIEGRMFVHPGRSRPTGFVRVNGRVAAKLEAAQDDGSVHLQLTLGPADLAAGVVRLSFHVDSAVSPSSLGVSSDVRCLGFGLARMLVE